MARTTAFDFDILYNVDCWQNDFRKAACRIMKNRKKIPICIPSYGRPEARYFQVLAEQFNEFKNYPIHIFVNDDQYPEYKYSPYLENKPWITIHHFPNEEISDIGLKRSKIVDVMYDLGYDTIFMHDDDIGGICPSIPSERPSGPIARSWVTLPHYESYCMWQLAAEYAWHMFDRAVYCLPMVAGFSWMPDFAKEETSYVIRGLASVSMCLNIKRLKDADLNFLSNKNNHHEDFDLEIRAIEKGYYPIEIHWMTFTTSANRENIISEHATFLERYKAFQEQMLKDFKHLDWVIARNRGEKPNVGINWNKAKAYLVENGYLDGNKYAPTKYQINMWQGGKMLEYFENN